MSPPKHLGIPAPISPISTSSAHLPRFSLAHEVRKYAFIDALRGYAVLLVIICHTGYAFTGLPYPIKKITSVGWHGVQLFFLISCVTLMMSWRSDERKGISNAYSFWTRRFFRIAPMYYLAAVFYFLVEPPATGFDPLQLLASVAFLNAWHPLLVPTVAERWMVVPGGWSIGVEFTFYFLFPTIAIFIRSLKAATAFFISAIILACLSNMAVYDLLASRYGVTASSNFIYFWLPNQLPIFALGTVLFFLIDHLRHQQDGIARLFRKAPNAVILLCIAIFALLAEFPSGITGTFHFSPTGLIPFLLLASLLFMAFSITLALNDRLLWTNRAICALGEVSFSAYILHFFVLHQLANWLPAVDTSSTGYAAIKSLVILVTCTVALTFALSKLTYRFIEQPAIRFGSRMAGLFVRICPPAVAS